jgi:hypothetical protein
MAMTAKSTIRKSVLATLAAATALTAIPATAFADPGQRQGQGREERGNGNGGQRSWGGGQPQQQQQPQRPVFQPRVEAGAGARVDAPRPNVQRPDFQRPAPWQGRGQADAAPRWGQQAGAQSPSAQTRDWNNARDNRQAQPGGQPSWRGPDNRGDNHGQFPGWRDTNRDGRNDGVNRNNGGHDWNRDGRVDNRDWHRDGRVDNHDWNRNDDRNRDGDRWRNDGWRNNRGGYTQNRDWRGNDYRRWDNDWRRDNRYNWSGWRNEHRDAFRGGYYYAPYRGYSYNRLSIGVFLGAPFYSDRYWIDDPWSYRLPPAYGPYRWVRYYDDVLLVDTFSGQVVDVIYDFFW